MLFRSMIEEMLKTLQKEYSPKNYQDYNNEHDFSKVLKFCADNTPSTQTLRYADGKEEIFSFEK